MIRSLKILQRIYTCSRKCSLQYLKVSHFNNFCIFPSFDVIMATNRYCVDLAKRGTAGCKNCNQKIEKGFVRIGKIIPNPFTESGGDMKQWFHVRCMFEKLSRARATTKKIDSTDDLEGWDDLADEHKGEILKCLSEFSLSSTPKKTPKKTTKKGLAKEEESIEEESSSQGSSSSSHNDNSFREFRKLCKKVADESSYLEKAAIFRKFFTKGSDGNGFKGDLYLWVKLLLPNVDKRVYNVQSKQLVKLFSEIFQTSHEEMVEDLGQGDVAQTIGMFYQNSTACVPASKSTLSLQEVDKYLDDLTKVSREADQSHILKKVTKRCTANDLTMFIHLIKHDLRINAGAKPVLDAIHPSAYEAFQASQNLKEIINSILKEKKTGGRLTVQASLMTPVLPMLAMACGSVAKAFEKYPKGFFVEIKYDGERVQLHKKGMEFSYFSRSLKPVMPHKVMHLKDYIPKAFPHGNNLILDCEVLLVNKEGIPLPFGTLGAHRKTAFKDANVCLFIFDCLQFNDENLMKKPLIERRRVLHENMTEIKNHIMFSEMKEINDPKELRDIINSVIQQGLEGIVIKDKMSVYEPGKRHWLKVKKDYLKAEDLKEGTMPDTADLVVLGAYYGSGKFGGMKSIFLMGCYDEYSGKWCTVTKVKGFTDDVLKKLQSEPEMIEIKKNPDLVPSWLKIKNSLVPDFLIKDIEKSAVWEIMGTEFSKAEIHTANGISIRFPRVKCFRDKHWKQSTTLKQLQDLYNISKQTADVVGLQVIGGDSNDDSQDEADSTITDSSSPKTKVSKGKSLKRPSEEDASPPKKDKKESPAKNAITDYLSNSPSRSKNEANTESPAKKIKKDLSNSSKSECETLPNIFSGVKLYIPASVDDSDTLRRYFVAYDGELLKSHQKDEANVVIHSNNAKKVPKNAEVVTVEWLWACIKLKKRLPTSMYKPNNGDD